MSAYATTSATPSRRGTRLDAALPVALGIGALLLRARVLGLPGNDRVVALGCIYAAMLAGSLLAPVAKDEPLMRPVLVLAIGLAAVGIAATTAGRPVAMSFAPLALPLSLLAAVAEEALFRRAAYGWLERYGVAAAIIGSASLFALVHLPFYGLAALPVDFGAGLLLSWQRWASGTWTVPAATHAAANFLAVILR
jgi:membrane protease YdiL (CAAX protease family)